MVKKKNSITQTFLYNMVIVTIIVTVIIDSLWIYQTYMDFEKNAKQLRKNYILHQKSKIKNEVNRIISYIDYKKKLGEERIKASLKMNLNKLLDSLLLIGDKTQNIKNKQTRENAFLQKIITYNSSSLNYDYFVFDQNGNSLLSNIVSDYSLKNDIPYHINSEQKTVIRKIIESNKSKKNQYNSFFWNVLVDSNNKGKKFLKIGYVKLFKQFNWYVGVGENTEYFTTKIQKEVLGWLGKIKLADNEYFFIDQFDGTPVITDGTAVIQDVFKAVTPEAKAFFNNAGDIVRKGGGFIYYPANKPEDEKFYNKISYINSIADWKWIVGAGVFLEDIEKEILLERSKLEVNTTFHICAILSLLGVFIIFSFLIAGYIARRAKRSFDIFSSFFEEAATKSTKIDSDRLHFREFDMLACSANKMIEKRNLAEEALNKHKTQLEEVVKERTRELANVNKTLQKNEERLNYAVMATSDGLWDWNINTDKVYYSPRYFTMLGYKPFEFSDEFGTLLELTFEDDRSIVLDSMNKYLEKGDGSIDLEFRMVSKNGELRWIYSRGKIVEKNAHNKPIRIVGTHVDITDKKRTEQALTEKQAQLVHSSRLAALGEMAAGMAHEINQPLSTITFVMKNILLAIESNDADLKYFKKKTDKIMSGIERITNIINHVRVFSREQADFSIIKRSFNVNHSIKNAVSLITQQYKQHGIKLSLDYGNDLMCGGDKYKLEQVVLNLLSNAKDAVESKSHQSESDYIMQVAVKSYKKKSSVFIEVEDNGIGIGAIDKNKLIQPFFTTKKEGKGTGLGLSISYGIIKNMQGDIDFFAAESGGAISMISLPFKNNNDKEL